MKALRIFLTIVSFLVYTQSFANSTNETPNETPKVKGSIKGNISDSSSGKAMEYANIKLFSKTDSSLITGTITQPDGSFELNKIDQGNYYLEVSFIGFENKLIDNLAVSKENKNIDLGKINLSPASQAIDAVNVTAEKSSIEYQIDKKVINVDKKIVAAGGTAVQVLENTPSVQVDAEGNVSLRGSSDFVVLIDDKPTVLKGNDALKQIPAANIEKVEVITNPSAKYEADGTSGIINIKMKKNKVDGLNGMISGSAGTGDKYSSNANFNYRKGKVNVFVGGDYMDNTYSRTLKYRSTQILSSGTKKIDYDGDMSNYVQAAILKGGVDYYINDNNSLSVSGSWGDRGYDSGTKARYSHTSAENIMSYSKSDTEKDVYGRVAEINTDFSHTFGENHNWITTFHYESWDGHNNDILSEFTTNDSWNNIGVQSQHRYKQDEFNYLYRINTDYKRPIGENGKLEAGYQYRFHDRMDDLTFENYNTNTKTWENNSKYTNKMNYTRSIHSTYAMYANKIWGIGYQMGLRAEYTDREIEMTNTGKTHTYENLALFPSVHLSKEFENKTQLQLNFSRRTQRPVAWLLNGTPSYIDPNNVFKGNPDVKPEYINSYEFNYRRVFEKITVSAQTYYRKTKNNFTRIRTMDDSGLTTHEFANSGQSEAMGLELGTNLNLVKWMQLSLNTNIYNYQVEGDVNSTSASAENNTWDANLNATFPLKWGTYIQLNSYYSAENVDLQGKNSDFYVVSLSINQYFLNGRANLGITARDLFNSLKFSYDTNMPNYSTKYDINPEQVFIINFSYRFNNYNHKQRGSRDQTQFGGSGDF